MTRLKVLLASSILFAGAEAAAADLCPAPSAGKTALQTCAESMTGGQWKELVTNGIRETLDNLQDVTDGNLMTYAEELSWDPARGVAYFVGGDHQTDMRQDNAARFVRYVEATNTWEIMPRPAWLPYNANHEYDHSAINPSNGDFFHRRTFYPCVFRYTPSSGNWAFLPLPNGQTPATCDSSLYDDCCEALEYYPEMGGLLWVRTYGKLYLYAEDAAKWRQDQLGKWNLLATGLDFGSYQTWNIAERDPLHGIIIFGNGNSKKLYRLTPDGAVTALGAVPAGATIYDGSSANGVFTVDPSTGRYLLLTATDRRLWGYDGVADRWEEISTPSKPNLTGWIVTGTPVSTRGVVFFAACRYSDCHVFLYKNALQLPPPAPPAQPTGLAVR